MENTIRNYPWHCGKYLLVTLQALTADQASSSANPSSQQGSSGTWSSLCLTSLTFWPLITSLLIKSFPGGSNGAESACNVGDPGLTPGSGRSFGEGDGNPLQYSCLRNPMNRGFGGRQYNLCSHKDSHMTERLTLSCLIKAVHYPIIITKPVWFSSVAQSCPTLCDPMDCGTPGFRIHH